MKSRWFKNVHIGSSPVWVFPTDHGCYMRSKEGSTTTVMFYPQPTERRTPRLIGRLGTGGADDISIIDIIVSQDMKKHGVTFDRPANRSMSGNHPRSEQVSEENFHEVLPPGERDEYWRRVTWAFTEVFGNQLPALVSQFRLNMEARPLGEQIMMFHSSPMHLASDLAGVTDIKDEEYAKYRAHFRW